MQSNRQQGTEALTVSQNQQPKAAQVDRRKTALSPELREVLHMLKALEAELAERQLAAS